MALSTSSLSAPTMQSPAPTGAGTPPTPVIFDDLQPVYLAKLYPAEVSEGIASARDAALAAGEAAIEQGATLIASQQEPIPTSEPEPPPAPPPSGGTTE